jgi:hypothetical protein
MPQAKPTSKLGWLRDTPSHRPLCPFGGLKVPTLMAHVPAYNIAHPTVLQPESV